MFLRHIPEKKFSVPPPAAANPSLTYFLLFFPLAGLLSIPGRKRERSPAACQAPTDRERANPICLGPPPSIVGSHPRFPLSLFLSFAKKGEKATKAEEERDSTGVSSSVTSFERS